jgi:hypothetical protein
MGECRCLVLYKAFLAMSHPRLGPLIMITWEAPLADLTAWTTGVSYAGALAQPLPSCQASKSS